METKQDLHWYCSASAVCLACDSMHCKISQTLHLSSLRHATADTNGLMQSRMDSSSYSSIRCNLLIHTYTIVIHLQFLYVLKHVIAETSGLMQSRKDSSSYSSIRCNLLIHNYTIVVCFQIFIYIHMWLQIRMGWCSQGRTAPHTAVTPWGAPATPSSMEPSSTLSRSRNTPSGTSPAKSPGRIVDSQSWLTHAPCTIVSKQAKGHPTVLSKLRQHQICINCHCHYHIQLLLSSRLKLSLLL